MFSSALVVVLVIPIVGSMTILESKHLTLAVAVFVINSLTLGIIYGHKIVIIWIFPGKNIIGYFRREIGVTNNIALTDAAITHNYIRGN